MISFPRSAIRDPRSEIPSPVSCKPVSADGFLKVCAAQVEARLGVLLPSPKATPAILHEAMRYSALAPGKRLRPALVIASAEAVGGASPAALDAACAVEVVHAFSLIHDDLPAIDDDNLRRGRPTCHVQFGEAIAILAGDSLFALAFEILSGVSAPADRVVRAVRSLATSSGSNGLVGGETVDVLSEGKPYDQATLEYIHSHKTGSLMAAACEIGGLIGGGTDEQVEALRRYGQEVGLAFQIADDLLNELSTADALGKATGSDRAREKATYPAMHGIPASREAARDAVHRAFQELDPIPDTEQLSSLARYAMERAH